MNTIPIGNAVFDPSAGMLRDSAGAKLALRPQTLRVLECLVAANGGVLTKEQLASQVWDKLAVTDDSLVQCIGEIRAAIGDAKHQIFQTEHRRGYRLVLDAVRAESKSAAAEASGLPEGQAAPAIAVMAFGSMEGDERSERLAVTFASDLISELARHRELRIISRFSSFALAGQGLGSKQVCECLNARFLVTGDVQFSTNSIDWSLEMIDGLSEEIVWSERKQIKFADINADTSALIWRMAGSIHGNFQTFTSRQSVAKSPESCNAYDLVARASAYLMNTSVEGTREGQRLAALAVELYPDYGRAWRMLAFTHEVDIVQRHTGEWTDARVADALFEVRRAIKLDPTQARAFGVLGALLLSTGQVQEAELACDQSVELAHGDPVMLGFRHLVLFGAGRFTDAKADFESIASMMPRAEIYILGNHGRVLLALGEHRAAVKLLQQTLTTKPGDNLARMTLVVALEELGDTQGAREHFRLLLAHTNGFDESFFGKRWAAIPEVRMRYVTALRAHGLKPERTLEPPKLLKLV